MTAATSKSPAYYARRRFLKNKPAVAGLLFILLCTLIAIPGPLILPDSSPDSNMQHLELETRKPGFKVQFLVIPKENAGTTSIMGSLLKGKEAVNTEIPISGYIFRNDSIIIAPFQEDKKPEYSEGYLLAGIVHQLPSNSNYTRNGNDISFRDNDGKPVNTSIGRLKQTIKDDNIISRTYWLGTDRYGRDMLSRLLLGTRISLSVGLVAVAISLLIGVLLGALAGFFRGWVDEVITWVINVIWSVPTLLLVMAVSLALGRGFWQVFVAVGLTMWVEVARQVRGQLLSARELEYVQAGRALGFRSGRLIFRHILPNILGPVLVLSAANFASAILLESGLSFLGVGVQPPAPSWGVMLNDHFGYIVVDSAYLAILPGVAIMLVVLAFNLLGNGLRDALDVRMKN